MINSILAKIVTTEDAKYANKPVDFTKLDYEDNSAPLVEVVDPETKETIFMPLEKLDSGDSISLPDYGPTTTKVQREINTDLLKEKILETRKKFGTLGKSKILHVPQESELTKASENIKGFLEERRFDFDNIRSKLTEARHKLFDSGEFSPMKNPDIKSLLRSLEESLDRIKPKLPSLYEPKLRLRRSIAKRSIVDDLAEEVDKLKEKFSSFVDDVFGKIKTITKRSAPEYAPDEKKIQSIDSLIDSIMGDGFFKEIDELHKLANIAQTLKNKTEKNEIGACKCKESAALEDLPKPEVKTKTQIASDPSDLNLPNFFLKGLSQISQLFSASDKEKQ